MKSWTLTDELKADAKLAAAVEALRPSLKRIAGPRFAPDIDVRWGRADGGVTLWLADSQWPEGVETVVPLGDLAPGPDADSRLRWALLDMHLPGTRAIVDRLWAEVEVV